MSSDGRESLLPSFPEGYRLRTGRLVLRALSEEDDAAFWPLVSDARLSTFLAWNAHQTIDETSGMLAGLIAAQKAGNGFHWAVTHDGQIVGLVSLIDVKRRHRSWTLNRAELAYWIGVPFQGNGYATEAAAAVMEYGFSKLGLHKIRVYHAADNPASERTIAKLHYRFVGEELDAFQKGGRWHHLRHFELLESEFSENPIHSLGPQE